jgi:hypothetical protein
LKDGLGPDHAGKVIKEASYETYEPTVDSQIATLQGSGADVLLIAAIDRFAAQAIRRAFDLDWTPTRYLAYPSRSVVAVMKLAGLEKSKGVISANFAKDPTDARWKDDPGMKEWQAFCAKYLTQTDLIDANGSRRSTAKAGSCSARFWRLDRKLPPSGPFRVKVLDRELTVTRPAPDPSRMVTQDEFQIPTRAAATTPPATTCPE